jgi:hypothetical protein
MAGPIGVKMMCKVTKRVQNNETRVQNNASRCAVYRIKLPNFPHASISISAFEPEHTGFKTEQ